MLGLIAEDFCDDADSSSIWLWLASDPGSAGLYTLKRPNADTKSERSHTVMVPISSPTTNSFSPEEVDDDEADAAPDEAAAAAAVEEVPPVVGLSEAAKGASTHCRETGTGNTKAVALGWYVFHLAIRHVLLESSVEGESFALLRWAVAKGWGRTANT